MHCRTYRPRRDWSFSFASPSYCIRGKRKTSAKELKINQPFKFFNKEKIIVLQLTDQFIANFIYRICNPNSSVKYILKSFFFF